ncbi:MAG: hypothetical protein J7L73_07255, partial [Anaerolineales bacterium]|nr:hypothetical protein [Anaerolineales bacterium]
MAEKNEQLVLKQKVSVKNRELITIHRNNRIFEQKPITNILICIAVLIVLPCTVSGQAALIQHLDATVEGSVVTDGTNAVTEWKDQTSFHNNAIPKTGGIYKVQEDKLTWLDFGTDRNVLELFSSAKSDVWLDQSNGTNGFCVILSFKTTGLQNEWNDLIGNSSATSDGFGLRFSSSGSIKSYLGGKVSTGSNIEIDDVVVLAFNYNATTGQYELWDSKSKNSVSGTVSPHDFSLSEAVTLGSTTNSSRYFQGYVGEVKIYNKTLSDEDFKNERLSLFIKWTATELDPPTPNPATFEIAPNTIGGTTISMTATTGTDASGLVEYYFEETTGNAGGDDSGWQSSPYYSDGGLTPHTEYSYRVTLRDAYQVTGETSQVFRATTSEAEPWKNDLDFGAYYGYQAWHRGPKDSWSHWFDNGIPDAAHMSGDNWPDFSEYSKLYETQLRYPNGSPVKVYSCNDYETVDVHIRWMKEYGIKGCFLQRQQNDILNQETLAEMDRKALHVRRACEKYGVKFCLMPCNNDKSEEGKGEEYINAIIADWKHCVDDLKITESPMYMHQNGKPVIGFWGIGLSNRQMTPGQATQILDSFQQPDELKYQVYVMGGVPNTWRTKTKEGFMPVFERLDMISPWRPVFYDPYNQDWLDRMAGDKAYCDARGIDYNPTVSPGASVAYQHDDPSQRNKNPRNGGKYLWKQVYEVCKLENKFIYVAMYDEIDEGTAMYKMAETQEDCPVLDPALVPLNEDGYNLPSDWYLQIGTEIQKMLDGRIALTEELPLSVTNTNSTSEMGLA